MTAKQVFLELTDLPDEVRVFLYGAKLYDYSMSPTARVYFVDKDCGFFLKIAEKGQLQNEAEMTRYFHVKHLSSDLLLYRSGEYDCMVTSRVVGDPLTHSAYLARPEWLAEKLGETLRMLHEADFADCPVPDRNKTFFQTVEDGYRSGRFDPSLFSSDCNSRFAFRTAEEAYELAQEGRGLFSKDVLLHGDYCLPNIIFNQDRFSAFIDLGNGGVGDRHIDLFWGAWTLVFNLKTDRYTDRFLDAYGRDLVDLHKLKTVAASETFG